ncbi:MAG: hypothetical protein JSS87_04945 [Acidobacteria bacterium]|nr:hypothetical protein [Acidobacteriota bacterium]
MPDLPHAAVKRPPAVVASVYQTGLNLMRDLLRHGIEVVGIDCIPEHPGFRSSYGKSYLCPNPDTHPDDWVVFMVKLAQQLGGKPVLMPAADIFVSAMGRHASVLAEFFTFSMESIAVQAILASKERQYALAEANGLPIPNTAYVQSAEEMQQFAETARFPCLVKPRHQREWDALPESNPLRGLKVFTAQTAEELLRKYAYAEPMRPEAVVQEIIAGGDDVKFCYLSVYGKGSRRLGYCVVRELRAQPIQFGSGSISEPVIDEEIAALCDRFLHGVNYVGICEIEVKRDARDGVVRLIEANPRFSVTADAAIYAGVEIGWLNYLDLIGKEPEPMEPTHFNFRHVVLQRDVRCIPQYIDCGMMTWGDAYCSYQKPLKFFDFDLRDRRPSMDTVKDCLRVGAGTLLRKAGLRPRLPNKQL